MSSEDFRAREGCRRKIPTCAIATRSPGVNRRGILIRDFEHHVCRNTKSLRRSASNRLAGSQLYVLSLVLSEVRTYFQQRNNPQYAALGASGAVTAVLFASIVYFPARSIFILPIPIPIPAPLFAVGYLAYT